MANQATIWHQQMEVTSIGVCSRRVIGGAHRCHNSKFVASLQFPRPDRGVAQTLANTPMGPEASVCDDWYYRDPEWDS
jgi:hypothetical protein